MGKKKNKAKEPEVMEIKEEHFATEKDIQTTHTLVTRSINMMLSTGIRETREKNGNANVDINPKAIEFAIKWCSHNDIKFKTSEEEENFENDVMSRITKEQRDKLADTKH